MAQYGDFIYEEFYPGFSSLTGYTGSGGEVIIPSSLGGLPVYSIEIAAFAGAEGHLITSIVIPNTVNIIEQYAFIGCTLLTSVIIGASVGILGDFAFADCESLQSIIIPGGVEWIGSSVFSSCYNLSSIIFTGLVAPSTVESNWIQWTSSNIKGYAYPESNFPYIGETFYGLLMGILVDFERIKIGKRTYKFYPKYDIKLDTLCTLDNIIYYWQFGDGSESPDKTPIHIFPRCEGFEVTLSMSYAGITDSITKIINLTKTVSPNFEISGNYGPSPLTFQVVDTTDYECTGFYPTRWTWYIIYFGCLITRYGYGRIMNLSVSVPGQYGIKMIVSNGRSTYSVIKRDVVFVTDSNVSDAVQIELAHESDPVIRRHLIKTKNNFTDPKKNTIEFYIWGTELVESEVAENELMEIRGDDKLITKNLYPKSNLIYNIGSELQRWEELVGKEADILTFTEAKILRLWSGK